MLKAILSIFLVISLISPCPAYSQASSAIAARPSSRLGIWITVFSPYKVLHSKANADSLIDICKKSGISDIFLQVYRGDKAYYDSSITDKTPFETALRSGGEDLIPYLIRKAGDNGIRVHAWLNMLSISQNQDANILKKIGSQITTKDQYGRTSFVFKKDKLDNYYIRENQLFIDPGYPEVRDYLTGIVEEIIRKYPGFAGIHLDYIRYPSVVPFIPGSRFTSHGISYGYNWPNIKAFRDMTDKDIREVSPTRAEYMEWDELRRNNVTSLVKQASDRARAVNPRIEVSCAIVPSIERSYLVTFQDWTRWLEEDLADFIVIMNYTDDTPLFKMNTQAMRLPSLQEKVMVGVGAYILKEKPEVLEEQLSFLKDLSPTGIVIFSYDDIAESERLQGFLSGEFSAGGR